MFYVFDDNNNKIEALDKEGVLAVLEEAIENGSLDNIDADSAFVSKLKDMVNGTTHHVAFVTQAQYNQLEAEHALIENTYYFITDDLTLNNIDSVLQALVEAVNAIPTDFENRFNTANKTEFGNYVVPKKRLLANLGGGATIVDIGSYIKDAGIDWTQSFRIELDFYNSEPIVIHFQNHTVGTEFFVVTGFIYDNGVPKIEMLKFTYEDDELPWFYVKRVQKSLIDGTETNVQVIPTTMDLYQIIE